MESRDKASEKNGTIKIREMDIDDLAPVFHLGEKLFKAEETPNLYRTWESYEVVGLFQSAGDFCQVAEAGGRIVGFALGDLIDKSRSAWKYGYLIWLGVAPEYQKQGVAEKLFRRFKDLALENGARMLLADTQAGHLPALGFFRKMGFGHPQQHTYLTMNLAAERQRRQKKKNGGK